MSSLYRDKRSGIWYFKIMVGGKRKTVSTKMKNIRDAKQYVKKYESKMNEGPDVKLSPYISEGLNHYITVTDIREATKKCYRLACEHLITAAKDKRIDEYSIMDYEKLINYMNKKNYSEASKGIYTRALFAIFNYYLKNDYISKNPIKAIRKSHKPKPINQKELETIESYIRKTDPEFYKLIKLALLTGFRRSTLTEPMTIDVRRGIISARNVKVGRDFQFPIYTELENYFRELGIGEFFVGKLTPLTRDAISHKFQKVVNKLKAAGKIENKYNFHCLRHTAATGWGRRGLDIKSVKTLLDHTDIKTSEHYVESDYGYIKSKLS